MWRLFHVWTISWAQLLTFANTKWVTSELQDVEIDSHLFLVWQSKGEAALRVGIGLCAPV